MSLNSMSLNPAPPSTPGVYDSLDAFVGAINPYLDNKSRRELENARGVTGSYGSCGISVLSSLQHSTPEQQVNKILKERSATEIKKTREAFVMFSDVAGESRGGTQLYNYIKANNLGNIVQCGPRMNPNSGNQIYLWIWEPPHESLSPKNKCMPVYGKVLESDGYGNMSVYKDDPRFKSTLNTVAGREA